jgi:phosphoenolpyruvate carboxylase
MTDAELTDRLRSSANKVVNYAAERIETLTAKLAVAMEGLKKCQEELDEYSRQEYPLDHTVHERYRQRDYDANPARITLAALKGAEP